MPEPLIDQKFLERLERLTLHWQKSFPGLVGGHNASRYPGSGQEFLDHRGFHQGDDLRAVNWRAYMRLEKLILLCWALIAVKHVAVIWAVHHYAVPFNQLWINAPTFLLGLLATLAYYWRE